MRIALLGYGKMGKLIERIAIERGHEVVVTVDETNRSKVTDDQLKQADVAIEFTMPAVAVENYNGVSTWGCRWFPEPRAGWIDGKK